MSVPKGLAGDVYNMLSLLSTAGDPKPARPIDQLSPEERQLIADFKSPEIARAVGIGLVELYQCTIELAENQASGTETCSTPALKTLPPKDHYPHANYNEATPALNCPQSKSDFGLSNILQYDL